MNRQNGKHRLFVLLVAGVVALGACAPTVTAVKAGPYQTPNKIGVTLQNAWSLIPAGLNPTTTGVILTRHGVTLNRIDILAVKPGGRILKVAKSVDAPTYRAEMTEEELVDFVTASLTRIGFADLQALNVRPQQFGAAGGIRFALSGKYTSGLAMKGDVALARTSSGLNVIMFLAPAAHYYDLSAGEVDALIASAKVV